MVQVPPGTVSGLFYVGFGGADFTCDWKDIKDFLRSRDQTLLIDHVEVYQEACKGNGWVRVCSEKDFWKVYKLLDGAHIKGHTIMADDRNAYSPTTVLNVTSSSRKALPIGSIQPLYSPPASPVAVFPIQSSLQCSLPHMFENHPTFASTDHGIVLQQVHHIFPPVSPIQTMSPNMQPWINFHGTPTIEVLPLESSVRKVIITRLPVSTTQRDIRCLIYKRLHESRHESFSTDPIQAVDVPKDRKKNCHAFVTFASSELANLGVYLLDGFIYRNKTLQVRLTKEGGTPPLYRAATPSPLVRSVDFVDHQYLAPATIPDPPAELKESKLLEVSNRANCGTPMVANGSGAVQTLKKPKSVDGTRQ